MRAVEWFTAFDHRRWEAVVGDIVGEEGWVGGGTVRDQRSSWGSLAPVRKGRGWDASKMLTEVEVKTA